MNTYTCQSCKHQSLNFGAFSVLNLPIPKRPTIYNIKLLLVNYACDHQDSRIVNIDPIQGSQTMADLRQMVLKKYPNLSFVFAAVEKSGSVLFYTEDDEIMSIVKMYQEFKLHGGCLVAYEIPLEVA